MKIYICEQTGERIFGAPVELKNFDFPWEKDHNKLGQDKHFTNSYSLIQWFVKNLEQSGFEVRPKQK